MQSLGLALRARGDEGQALPNPIARLEQIGVKFRRSQLSMIAGAPGGGKTALTSWITTRMAYDEFRGVPTMYFSADADRMTMAKTIGAGVLGKTLDETEGLILNDSEEALSRIYGAVDHVWWSFDAAPDFIDINEELEGYAYVHGEYPHLIVIDNLQDIAEDGEDFTRMSDALIKLKALARFTGAHVLVLCHVTGEYTDGNTPIPRSAVMYKLDKKAELILTLYRPSQDVMGVQVVKNRTGKAFTNGSFGIQLPWNPETGWIGE